jgi:CelD/BcsL family acetyltransferase involved in cellulose biosynthesis
MPETTGDIVTQCITSLADLEQQLNTSLCDWDRIVHADPLASVFQGPGWCMNWYRAYGADYTPFVIAVRDGGLLVGIVPLAIDQRTGEVIFASGNMADYRDVAALPGYREIMVRELIRVYSANRFNGPLRVGWIDPASDTPGNIARICQEQGLDFHVNPHACWRWFPVEGENLNKKFSRVKTHLNYFKRQGEVTFDVITRPEEWARFRDEFFQQHSLRQLQAGRAVSFHDARKQNLYDRLLTEPLLTTHVTALRVDGRLLAGHVGLVWRDVLLLGAPSISIEDEGRSPALILISWIIQNAQELGLKGFDLTIGDSEFKRRIGNQRFELQTISIYTRRRDFVAIRARTRVTDFVKSAVAKAAGPDAWDDKVKEFARQAGSVAARLRHTGPASAFRAAAAPLWERREAVLYQVTPDTFRASKIPVEMTVNENRITDLLLWKGGDFDTDVAIGGLARSCARLRTAGNTIHTALVQGLLVAWGCSTMSQEPAPIAEAPGAMLECEPGSALLTSFWFTPAARETALPAALLSHLVEKRTAEGAQRVYLVGCGGDRALSAAAAELGFRVVRRWTYAKTLGKEVVTSKGEDSASAKLE